jgi:hypothetical protein
MQLQTSVSERRTVRLRSLMHGIDVLDVHEGGGFANRLVAKAVVAHDVRVANHDVCSTHIPSKRLAMTAIALVQVGVQQMELFEVRLA